MYNQNELEYLEYHSILSFKDLIELTSLEYAMSKLLSNLDDTIPGVLELMDCVAQIKLNKELNNG